MFAWFSLLWFLFTRQDISVCKARQARLLENVNKHSSAKTNEKRKAKMWWKAHKSHFAEKSLITDTNVHESFDSIKMSPDKFWIVSEILMGG